MAGLTPGKTNFFRPTFGKGPSMGASGGMGGGMANGDGGADPAVARMLAARARDPRWNMFGPTAYADQYALTGHGKSVTDAVNAGETVQPWAPSSGAGPGTYGYRGSYGGGGGGYRGHHGGYGGGYGGGEDFHTGRPTASTADEYYQKRDAAVGNPIDMLKMNGPNRGNLMQSMINESRLANGAVQGTDAYYAAKGLGPDGKTPLSTETPTIDNSGFSGYGTKQFGGETGVKTPEGMDLYGPNGKIGSSTFGGGSSQAPERAPLEYSAPDPFISPAPTKYTGGTFYRSSPDSVVGPKKPSPLTAKDISKGGKSANPDYTSNDNNNTAPNPVPLDGRQGWKYMWDIFRMMGNDFKKNVPKIMPAGAFGG